MSLLYRSLLVFALLVGGAQAQPRPAPVLSAWVQLNDGGVAEARAVVDGGACPSATVDGAARRMTPRVRPGLAFPQTVCVAVIPKGARKIDIGGRVLTAPAAKIDRIVILGDTGCRLKGFDAQACNDPRAWPFAMVARLAAAEKPDLVIHVGDYYYRESPCPLFSAGCAGSPYGDIWASWSAEFFEPARPLLEAAPWVFARGNHESCDRGWRGWFRLLEAGPPADSGCPSESKPFAVPIGGVTLHVLDSADAEDRDAPKALVAVVARQLDTLAHDPADSDWIITHRPFWGQTPVSVWPFGAVQAQLNKTEQVAARGKDLSGVAMIISGHIHHFSSFDFGRLRPAQLVVGTSGDVGAAADPATLTAGPVKIDGLTAETLTFKRYGYLVLERAAGGWTGVFKDLDGKPVARCTVNGRSLRCGPA